VSWLQFIADIKWALVALIVTLLIARALKKATPETRTAFRDAMTNRKLRAKFGDSEVELGDRLTEAVTVVAASDAQLQERLQDDASEPATPEELQQVRREALDQIIRQTVALTWTIRHEPFDLPPVPHVEWDGDRPTVTYGAVMERERANAISRRLTMVERSLHEQLNNRR
jgi:hypothetical protein